MRVRWGVLGCKAVGLAGALMLAACSGGGKVNQQLTNPERLEASKEAIAFIRFAAPDPSCIALGMQIGVREGEFFKPVQTLRLQTLAVTNVMEALVAPGEYHVVSLTCVRKKSMHTIWEPQGNGLLRRSYATFTVAAGEVINAGEIRVVKTGSTAGVFRPFVNVKIEVSDWPLSELERFKSQRPKHFAEMKTRLMTVDGKGVAAADVTSQTCAELKQLQAAGKVQNLPAGCGEVAVPVVKPVVVPVVVPVTGKK